jgi:hypothetical protein
MPPFYFSKIGREESLQLTRLHPGRVSKSRRRPFFIGLLRIRDLDVDLPFSCRQSREDPAKVGCHADTLWTAFKWETTHVRTQSSQFRAARQLLLKTAPHLDYFPEKSLHDKR